MRLAGGLISTTIWRIALAATQVKCSLEFNFSLEEFDQLQPGFVDQRATVLTFKFGPECFTDAAIRRSSS